MRKKIGKYKLILSLIFIIIICGIAFSYTKFNTQQVCSNPTEVKDFTELKNEAIKICNETLYIGKTKVVSKNEYPDLFQFVLNNDSKPQKVAQYVRVFEKDKEEYVSIKSVIDYTSWHNSAIGIYRKEENRYSLIFKKTFTDNQGRWVDIEFGEDYSRRDSHFYLTSHGEGISISGDLGFLGCLGACRMLWWDYYDWDSKQKTYVLANNKHVDQFKRLQDAYEEMDKTICKDEVGIEKSISSLYPDRKNKEKICSDDSVVPYTEPEQAEMLLKAIKAIKKIIAGENISGSEIKNISL